MISARAISAVSVTISTSSSAYGEELFTAARDAGEIRSDFDLLAVRMLIIGALNWTFEWPPALRAIPQRRNRRQARLRRPRHPNGRRCELTPACLETDAEPTTSLQPSLLSPAETHADHGDLRAVNQHTAVRMLTK